MPSFETTSALKTKHSWLHESGDNYLDLLRHWQVVGHCSLLGREYAASKICAIADVENNEQLVVSFQRRRTYTSDTKRLCQESVYKQCAVHLRGDQEAKLSR